jgi:hypothetical protein
VGTVEKDLCLDTEEKTIPLGSATDVLSEVVCGHSRGQETEASHQGAAARWPITVVAADLGSPAMVAPIVRRPPTPSRSDRFRRRVCRRRRRLHSGSMSAFPPGAGESDEILAP